jgi:hypothetical protein
MEQTIRQPTKLRTYHIATTDANYIANYFQNKNLQIKSLTLTNETNLKSNPETPFVSSGSTTSDRINHK